ncbi:site-specific integrase [Mesorhizobium sp. LNJC405B00]|uniref:tyrosine-type recombinase/integrase n=1 Tax=unclassified Mesorhizobium TaxID=325217 RepID=UPI0003CEDECA|nr:site-specific integrase [Mesorhizobium sp. LNJC405B00]ESX98659.1 integrase [Mesorhizobium sp. LNJC405B00]
MSIRKRKWTNAKGVEQEAWVADYFDAKGVRRLKTFAKKKDADAFASKTDVEVREGVHVADRDTVSIKKAGGLWIATGEGEGLERSTINQRRHHMKHHIEPFIGDTLLSKVDPRAFQDTLRAEGRSTAMVKKVLTSLSSILTDAIERKLATRNPVRDMRRAHKGREARTEKRQKGKIRVGVDVPAPEEIKRMIAELTDHWRPLLLTAIFTGLRSSEIRGLRWQDYDPQASTITVHQRADEFGVIGAPKSAAGTRTIPIPSILNTGLKEWRLKTYSRSPKENPLGLVFVNPDGKPRSHTNIINKGLIPAMKRAGVVTADGSAKYTGLHALRHFYASWCINPKESGGLGLPLKAVQERMGHSSVMMTADVYGHLFPRGDDGKELDVAAALLA